MSATVTLDRTSLSLPPLEITGSAPDTSGLFLDGSVGLLEPAFDVRATYAPDSNYVPGTQLLTAVLGASTLPLAVVAMGASAAGLATVKAELETAVWQFSYDVTLTVNGQPRTWSAGPCWPAWAELSSALADQHLARTAVVIPVNP